MLGTDYLQNLFSGVLSAIYEDAVLETWARSATRDPETGTFPAVRAGLADCKAQRDTCTEAQRGQDGYSAGDVRFMILQAGLSMVVNTDSRVIYRGQTWLVMAVDQDPARVYWDCRARLAP